MAKLNLNPLSDPAGAEILDFDITNFDAVKFKDIKIAWILMEAPFSEPGTFAGKSGNI